MNAIKNRWQTFIANYRWSDYVVFIDGWIPKLALSVPVFGYLILFNDKISEILIFKELANEQSITWGLSGAERLRLLYFGLIFLSVSNVIYRIKKPYQFKFGTNLIEYSRTCLETFTLSNYIDMHNNIRDEGHLTISGTYFDSEWRGFLEAAKNTGEGTDKVIRDGGWESAKSQYGNLLRNILSEAFFRCDTSRRNWLTICISISTLGYICLLLPSLDLFIKVLLTTFGQ